jgi:hypothetical protein
MLAANRESIRFAPDFTDQTITIAPTYRPNTARAPPSFS